MHSEPRAANYLASSSSKLVALILPLLELNLNYLHDIELYFLNLPSYDTLLSSLDDNSHEYLCLNL